MSFTIKKVTPKQISGRSIELEASLDDEIVIAEVVVDGFPEPSKEHIDEALVDARKHAETHNNIRDWAKQCTVKEANDAVANRNRNQTSNDNWWGFWGDGENEQPQTHNQHRSHNEPITAFEKVMFSVLGVMLFAWLMFVLMFGGA